MVSFDFNLAIVLLAISFITESVIAAHVYYRFTRNLQNYVFIALLLLSAYWSITYMIEIGFRANSAELRLLIIKFEIFGWIGVPYFLAMFFYIYSPLYNKKVFLVLLPITAIIPIASIVGMILQDVDGGYMYVHVDALSDEKNIGFSLLMYFNYAMTIAGIILGGIKIFHPRNKEAVKKKIAILVGILFPLVGNVVKNIIFPILKIDFEYDPTPISFALVFIFFMYGIFGLRILNILPRAMQDLFNQMNEGVIVLGKDMVVLKANQFALNLFAPITLEGDKINKLLNYFTAVEGEESGIDRIKQYFTQNERILENWKVIYYKEGKERYILYANITWITDRQQRKLGYLIIFHDYTERALLEEELAKQSKKLKETFEKLNPGVSEIITRGEMMLGEVCVTNHFCDLSGYTVFNMILGEKLTGDMMREFFKESHIQITKYHGYRDKIVGDQIRSIFGIRKDECQPSKIHAFDAIFTAIRINEVSKKISDQIPKLISKNKQLVDKNLKEYVATTGKKFDLDSWRFALRHGVSTSREKPAQEIDRVTMTMMGDESGWDYTSQGGSIILSSRLESQSKPMEISISENTNELIKRFFVTEEFPPIYLKNLGNYPYYKLIGLKTLSDEYFPPRVIELAKQCEPKISAYRNKIKIGAAQFYEISKITEWVAVDLEYVEHLKGVMNIGTFRAFWAIALARLLGISDEIAMFAAILDPVDYRDFPALNIVLRYKIDKQLPPGVNYEKITAVLRDSYVRNREKLGENDRLESEILRISRLVDDLTFDHTYLEEKGKSVLSLKEALAKLEGGESWNPRVIEAMKKLLG